MKCGATDSPVTQVDKRLVEADLTPGIDTVSGGSILANANKANTLVDVSSKILDANEKGDLLLKTVVEKTKSFVNDEPTNIWRKKHTHYSQTVRSSRSAYLPPRLEGSVKTLVTVATFSLLRVKATSETT